MPATAGVGGRSQGGVGDAGERQRAGQRRGGRQARREATCATRSSHAIFPHALPPTCAPNCHPCLCPGPPTATLSSHTPGSPPCVSRACTRPTPACPLLPPRCVSHACKDLHAPSRPGPLTEQEDAGVVEATQQHAWPGGPVGAVVGRACAKHGGGAATTSKETAHINSRNGVASKARARGVLREEGRPQGCWGAERQAVL